MKQELEQAVAEACQDLFNVEVDVELTRTEEQFGDYATNVALQLSKQVGKNPREIGESLAVKLRETLADKVSDIAIAGPGFINITLSDKSLNEALTAKPAQVHQGKEVLVEFGDPNPFKAMHIGHLYSYIVGDAICLLLEAAGAQVKRLSYHGDVGLHVAKALWSMQAENYDPEALSGALGNNIGLYYAKGAQAYEESEEAHSQIDDLNAKIYANDPSIQKLYEAGRSQSFANFDETLKEIGVINDQRYLESQSAGAGTEMVKQNVGSVFRESEGAIVYEGEKVGLHTRVFITGKNLPTYETKDLGLTQLKNKDYPKAALSIIITAHEQAEYFKVMLAALKEINPTLAGKTKHLSHGFVSLSSGKMSSRTGDIYSAVSLLLDVQGAAKKLDRGDSHDIQVGAVKYAFAKHRLGGDLAYDVEESISLEGNSGPYLQYAHARAQSILRKAETEAKLSDGTEFEAGERSLVRKITEYSEVIDKAVAELMPHHVCTYLYELAQAFNRFYENNRVIGDKRQDTRLGLVKLYADTLADGLGLLGIAAPDKM